MGIERHADYVDLWVRDTGRGIAAGDLERVFEMFYQGADAKGRDEGGLGLGLTLVQQLVQMHGGSVRAHSPGPGMGSEFSVRLPVASIPAQADAPAQQVVPATRSAGQRILVVDDNRDAVESLAQLLRFEGSEVQVAFDGDAAIETASRFKPDIVLLDIGMPIVDGYTAARTIRQDAKGRDMLLVAMTGWGILRTSDAPWKPVSTRTWSSPYRSIHCSNCFPPANRAHRTVPSADSPARFPTAWRYGLPSSAWRQRTAAGRGGLTPTGESDGVG